jgi:hypothetical protein
MWSYYGAKTNIVKFYPAPKHDKIIEPFCGTARYALRYFDHDCLLIDKYPVIINIWKWLQSCSPNDVLKLPRFKAEQTTNDFTFDCQEAKDFMGFIIGCGAERPRIKGTDRKIIQRPNHVNYNLKRIAGQLWKIKHWQFIEGDYTMAPDQEATFFIDPPYEFGGDAYVFNNRKINYPELAMWCRSRKGQVIVCENTKATWMDFNPIISQRGSTYKTTEAIWSNEKTEYDNQQQKLIF